ncbi:hypothetical protein DTO006G1_3515 [Penicillium roqueforti]|uniref:uncharacterized protein n=1 Tax=Penicillium roqueforti TaxID=5082 RepID=UPI00190B0F4F|nr:uncharacterized protein LCP9604111_8036 [Penicillium roqueforti]KAF9242472.1 hypothetical protein LCP9604111_8036 [Penicillium roqueforti]KAI1834657.1 hypothetical protein CBS147337_4211 [Penicillium roqueforti]KAI2676501.1 hypothetical protein CBS147355_5603 [Penicillium roqueforti]KAI2681256.1 hypothetical protein LCP963914a_6766 [Penicillium roqueforti]KAI2698079.1 hypothetical protein CBS147332_8634 [Penicillium roqueforti]
MSPRGITSRLNFIEAARERCYRGMFYAVASRKQNEAVDSLIVGVDSNIMPAMYVEVKALGYSCVRDKQCFKFSFLHFLVIFSPHREPVKKDFPLLLR